MREKLLVKILIRSLSIFKLNTKKMMQNNIIVLIIDQSKKAVFNSKPTDHPMNQRISAEGTRMP